MGKNNDNHALDKLGTEGLLKKLMFFFCLAFWSSDRIKKRGCI